ncbi:hypothetical protein Glove_66g104 [Diversispora epigaea]|uniref:Uncharacterized protein n=1 Tax=Diversispora epigaea TaxID=1348612 RepID=A0A397JLM8_9GLOM|nr:hypothetical protein Glove_66g104 [Diversispora epigaea]
MTTNSTKATKKALQNKSSQNKSTRENEGEKQKLAILRNQKLENVRTIRKEGLD